MLGNHVDALGGIALEVVQFQADRQLLIPTRHPVGSTGFAGQRL